MNEAERKKYDEAEASGQLPRFRLVVESFCAPIWWEIDHKTILGNGSMCVIATPQSVFGVTANHVLTIYEGHKVAHPDAFCQLGSAPFDPIANLIARSERWDLATFGIPDFTLKHWGRHHRIYKTEAWPPPTIKNNDQIILGGYPTNRRTQGSWREARNDDLRLRVVHRPSGQLVGEPHVVLLRLEQLVLASRQGTAP